MTGYLLLQTAKLDDFITEVNSASGLGSNGNSNVVFKGEKLESILPIIVPYIIND